MDNHRLGHATMAAPDRADSIIRRLEVHDRPRRRCKPMRRGPWWEKQDARGDADDKEQGLGDCWEHEIIEVASRAGIVRGHGPRTAETGQGALRERQERLAPGHVPGLVTTDEHSPYGEARLTVFGHSYTPLRASGASNEGV